MGAFVQVEKDLIDELYRSNPKRLLRLIALKSIANLHGKFIQFSQNERVFAPPLHILDTIRGIAGKLNIPRMTLVDDLAFFEKKGVLKRCVRTKVLLIIFNSYDRFYAVHEATHRTNSGQNPDKQEPLPWPNYGEKTHRVRTNSGQSPSHISNHDLIRLDLRENSEKNFERLSKGKIEKIAPFFKAEFERIQNPHELRGAVQLINNLRHKGFELEEIELVVAFLREYGIPNARGAPEPLKNIRPIEFASMNMNWLLPAIGAHERKENKMKDKINKIKKLAREATERFFQEYSDEQYRQEKHEELMRKYNRAELRQMPEDVRDYAPIVDWYERQKNVNS